MGNTYEATKKSERNKISFGAQLGMNSQSAARLTALNAISPRDGAVAVSQLLHSSTLFDRPRCSAAPHNDVVDGDEDQLHCVANEAHDGEANGTSDGNLLEPWRLWTLVGSCGL